MAAAAFLEKMQHEFAFTRGCIRHYFAEQYKFSCEPRLRLRYRLLRFFVGHFQRLQFSVFEMETPGEPGVKWSVKERCFAIMIIGHSLFPQRLVRAVSMPLH